jgi:predicted protein tyrosine phosphatase
LRRVLFVCARNRLRSTTAEALFAQRQDLAVSSAGTAPDAECPVSADLLDWATDIFVMEARQRKLLLARFGPHLRDKPVVVLGIPDRFTFMQPELVELLEGRLRPLLNPAL